MGNTTPHAATVPDETARTTALTGYLSRRLAALRDQLHTQHPTLPALNVASIALAEIAAMADVLDRIARAQESADRARSAWTPAAVRNAATAYRSYASTWRQSALRTRHPVNRRTLDIAIAEMDALAEQFDTLAEQLDAAERKPRPAHVYGHSGYLSLRCDDCDELLALIEAGIDLDELAGKRDAHVCESEAR